MARNCLIVLMSLQLSSCGWLFGNEGYFRDRQADYLLSPIEPEMQIPENLDSYTLDQLFVVPTTDVSSGEVFPDTIPRPKQIATNQAEGVVIQRIAGESWIVVAAPPQQVWPRVRDFWAASGIMLEYENPVEGVMDSVWLDSAADSENQSKFRVRIEPGLRGGSSEVYVYYVEEPRSTVGQVLVTWPEQSLSEGLGSELLDRVSQYLADRTDIYSSSSSSLLAGSLVNESKANLLTNSQGKPVLELNVGFPRAWAQLVQALERAEITVIASDRDSAVYTVSFAGAGVDTERPGFFSRLFRWGDNSTTNIPEFTISVEITDTGVRLLTQAVEEGEDTLQMETELLQAVLNNIG